MNELIVVVDDETDILHLVSLHLQKAGFRVRVFPAAKDFLQALPHEQPALIVLDLMLPDLDGFELCKQLRQNPEYTAIPIIMLTARTDELDRVLGLELGADDYITKPFSPRELVARVRAVLRRTSPKVAPSAEIHCGKLRLDLQKREAYIADRPLALTTTEFNLLALLAAKPGYVFTREQILAKLWGEDKIVVSRSVDVHVRNLRAKMGDLGNLIKNIRGVGYKLEGI